MKITEITITEGSPKELDEHFNGPRPDDTAMQVNSTAIRMLVRRTDELEQGIKKLLGVSDDKSGNK